MRLHSLDPSISHLGAQKFPHGEEGVSRGQDDMAGVARDDGLALPLKLDAVLPLSKRITHSLHRGAERGTDR